MSAKSVHRMIDRGELPAVVFPNGKKRVSEEALIKALRRSTRKHGACFDEATDNGDSPGRLSAVQPSDDDLKSA